MSLTTQPIKFMDKMNERFGSQKVVDDLEKLQAGDNQLFDQSEDDLSHQLKAMRQVQEDKVDKVDSAKDAHKPEEP